MAAVQVVRTARTRDPFLATCLRNTVSGDIDLIIEHIPVTQNYWADRLSRMHTYQGISTVDSCKIKERFSMTTPSPEIFSLDLII